MIEALNILSFFWLLAWAMHCLFQIYRGKYHSISFLILIHFLINGLPLLLDVIIGVPKYDRFPGFNIASRDETTAIIYPVFMSLIPIFWWLIGRPMSKIYDGSAIGTNLTGIRVARPILNLIMISPVIAVLFAPNPSLYLNYGWTLLETFSEPEIIDFHATINLLATLSLLSGLAILMTAKKIYFSTMLTVIPWILIDIWLNGKRYLVMLAVVAIGYILIQRGKLKRFDTIVAGFSLIALLLAFSFQYQETLRGLGLQSRSFEEVYENFRIDYGRDSRIKMAIYAELQPEEITILEYRGQSLLFYVTMYVPRVSWPEKPYPYAVYFTSAMFLIPPRELGWGMTTSWLDEAIANFSWAGFILGPLVPALVCRIGDKRRNVISSSLTILVSSLLLSLHLAAFAPIFILWLTATYFAKPNKATAQEVEADFSAKPIKFRTR